MTDSTSSTTATDARRPLRKRLYSLGEEIANSVSHGVGVLLGIAALVLLIVMAVSHGGGVRLAAAIIMGVSLIVEYLFSTLYHALAPEKAKAVFRVLDHCCAARYGAWPWWESSPNACCASASPPGSPR